MTAAVASSTQDWKDSKRYLWLLGLVVPLFPFISGAVVWATGSELGWWFGFVFLYGAIPLLDRIFGGDSSNPPEEIVAKLAKDRYYRYCVYAFIPLQFVSLFWGLNLIVSGDMGWFGAAGLLLTIGIVNGIAFNTAHELGHKTESLDRWLSKITLAPTGYGHFFVEHNRGHHVRVATPEDPASSRYGESFYEFLPRTIIGGYKSA